MATITTQDGIKLFYKDWGSKTAQPIVWHLIENRLQLRPMNAMASL